jgi:transcription termination factor Rho
MMSNGGRIINGIDIAALHRVRRLLGSARALEEGGSLTIIGVLSCDERNTMASALVEDLEDVVNWQLRLNRDIANQCIHPAIDVMQSGTLRSERLLESDELEKRVNWRSGLTGDLVKDASTLKALVEQ